MDQPPEISVIMSVYNCEKYLTEAVDSIINQTFKDFELIIVDDCSTDKSFEILKHYAQIDKRIKLIRNSVNTGLTKNLNKMLDLAQGKYIARMDADDISVENRLYEQYNFMEMNKDIDLCGTYIKKFTSDSQSNIKPLPVDHDEIKASLFFENVLMHPTIMIRRSSITKNSIRYNEDFMIMQDYELWNRVIDDLKTHNIPKVLLYQRVSANSISYQSQIKFEERKANYRNIIAKSFSKIGVEINNTNINYAGFFNFYKIRFKKIDEIINFFTFYKDLIEKNRTANYINNDLFRDVIGFYHFKMCYKHTDSGLKIFYLYLKNKITSKRIKLSDKLKFAVKCLFKIPSE